MDEALTIKQFKTYLNGSLKQIEKACKLFVEAIDEDSSMRDKIIAACPEIPKLAWKRFEAVGRSTMAVELLFCGSSCVEVLSKLPVSEQRKAVKDGVKVLENKEMTSVPMSELNARQAKKAISGDGRIRTLHEQQVYEKTHRKKDDTKVRGDKDDYIIKGSRVMFITPRYYTRSDLLKILEKMK